jgi:hypothetical protein
MGMVVIMSWSREQKEPLPSSSGQGSGAPWKFATIKEQIVYPPANKCIYCGGLGKGAALTDEHIIPLSLNGCAILPRASCCECQRIIHKYETDCIRDNFQRFRTQFNFRTRRPKERPTTFPIRYDDEKAQRFVPVEDHPILLVMPRFLEPGILRLVSPTPRMSSRLEAYAATAQVKEVSGRHNAQKISIDGKFNVNAFALVLAKIAQGFVWATMGESSFEPFLPDLILLKRPDLLSYLVGEVSSVSMPSSMKHDHFITFVVQPYSEGHLVLVGIRLFVYFPSPTYSVVVGKLIPSPENLGRLGLLLSGSTIVRASE